jgi:hypothetical protein
MVVAFAFLNAAAVSGQGNVSITAGFGFPDLLNAGIRYQIGQTQVGVSAGFFPIPGESMISGSFNLLYHFAGSSELSDRRPWYGRMGLVYLHDKKEGSFNDKLVLLDIRGGREFNISSKFGISLDAGIMFKLFQDVGENELAVFIYDQIWVIPAGGLGLFYRF